LLAGGAAPSSLPAAAPDTLAILRLDRSLLGFFRHADRLLGEGDAAQVKAGLSTAVALLGGASVVDDLLPGLAEPWTLFALLPDAGDDTHVATAPAPRIELPALALVARLGDPRAADLLLRFASNLFLISTGERGRRGEPPFLLRRRAGEGGHALVAEPPDWRGEGAPPTERTLSPTLWLGCGHAILASTEDGARRVAAALADPGERVAGDLLRVRGAAAAAALRRNREVLAVNDVLEKGGTLAASRFGFDALAAVAGALQELELRIVPEPGSTAVRLRLTRRRP
jgi:hypothetical protein